MYELEKFSLDDIHKYLHKREFERDLKNIYGVKSFNDMNCIHDNKVNNISE